MLFGESSSIEKLPFIYVADKSIINVESYPRKFGRIIFNELKNSHDDTVILKGFLFNQSSLDSIPGDVMRIKGSYMTNDLYCALEDGLKWYMKNYCEQRGFEFNIIDKKGINKNIIVIDEDGYDITRRNRFKESLIISNYRTEEELIDFAKKQMIECPADPELSYFLIYTFLDSSESNTDNAQEIIKKLIREDILLQTKSGRLMYNPMLMIYNKS